MPQHDDPVIKKVIHLKEKGWIPNEKDKRNLSEKQETWMGQISAR